MDKQDFQRRAISIFTGLNYHFHNFEAISPHEKEALERETAKLGELCNFIGIKIQGMGSVCLVLFVYSDDLTDEAIIGKCRLIRDGLSPFKKFALRFGWRKLPVMASVFFVFGSSEKAFHFRKSVQDHCKHHEILNTKSVLPFGIDVSAKSVWDYKGLPLHGFKLADIEARLFS